MLLSPNATRAYLAAGGTANGMASAKNSAYELLTNPDVRAVLADLRHKRENRTQVRLDWVVLQLVEVYERCMQVEEVRDKAGNPTGKFKFDSAGANRALDMLMKHVGGYEKDNRQKAAADPEEMKQALRDRGIPIDRYVSSAN